MDGPSFIVIGAHRAGISWLYGHLARHPDIYLPPELKEVFFWSIRGSKDEHWYKELFDSPKKIQGDIHSSYATLSPHLIHACHHNWPNVKLIYVAREPMERSWSMVRQKIRDFRLNHEILSDAWFIGHFEHPEMRARSDAVTCVESWLRFYPAESLLILDYEDLHRHPREFLRKVFGHIGVSEGYADIITDADLQTPVNKGPAIPMRPYLHQYLEQMYAEKRWFQSTPSGLLNGLCLAAPPPMDAPAKYYARDFDKHWFDPGESKKLHIGCDRMVLPGWINTNAKARPHDHVLALDPTRPLQLADESFDRILIKGLPSAPGRALRLLAECRRVLRPRGRLRVCVLSFDFIVRLYKDQSNCDIQRYIVWYTESFLPNSDYYSGALVANDIFRLKSHNAAHDPDSLVELLKEAGFEEPRIMEPGQSDCSDFKDVEDDRRLPVGLLKLESISAEVERQPSQLTAT